MRNLILLGGILVVTSCNNEASKEESAEDTLVVEETVLLPEEKLIWVTDFDTTKGEFFLRQQRKPDPATLNAQDLINDINAAWEDIQLQFIKISSDTIYVSIPNSEFLTQRMGSSGPASYLAATTFTLTELKGIKYVNYDFEEGEHLSPGTFSREDFKDFK